jgi:hypothetical protein
MPSVSLGYVILYERCLSDPHLLHRGFCLSRRFFNDDNGKAMESWRWSGRLASQTNRQRAFEICVVAASLNSHHLV